MGPGASRNRPRSVDHVCRTTSEFVKRDRVAGRMVNSAPRRRPAGKALTHFTIAGPFGEFPLGIRGQDSPPKGDRTRVAQVLDDFPFAGESVEDQGRRVPAYPLAAVRL